MTEPTRAERDNTKWIDTQVKTLPAQLRSKARANWALIYEEAYENEPDPNYKINRAMRAANTRLRRYVERVNNRV